VMWANNSPDRTLKTFTASPASSATYRFLRVHDDATHRVAWHAVLVKHHLETERRGHIERRAVTVLGKAPVAGRDERRGETFRWDPVNFCDSVLDLDCATRLRLRTKVASATTSYSGSV
jgi:hypothetical protein